MKRLEDLNFYELLEVAFDASPFEVHQAYKEMVQLYHDDSLASYSFFSKEEREEILAKLDEAYATLMDEKRRSRYDQLLIERGILEKATQYQRERRKLSLMHDVETCLRKYGVKNKRPIKTDRILKPRDPRNSGQRCLIRKRFEEDQG